MRGFLCSALVLCGCGSLYSQPRPPSGLSCDHILVASSKLTDTLAAAKAGDCVIAPAGTWTGSFVLEKDVSLAASEGATVVLQGDGTTGPVLTVMGGARSTVRNVRIATTSGTGIAIEPGPANLVGVSIGGAQKNALTASCSEADCAERAVVLEDCELTASGTGLLASGAVVQVRNSRIAEMAGPGLSDGSGVVATRGAQLSMEGVTVEGNQAVGVLVDGAGTRATLTDCAVRQNQGRGLWVQNVTDGGVSVTGGEFAQNRLLGVGVLESAGVTLSGLTVRDTVAVRVPIDLSTFEDVGDGVGLFKGAREVAVTGATLRDNARAQFLADACGAQVRVTNSQLSGGLFRAVVQHTAAAVDVPASLVDVPGKPLTVTDAPLPVSQ